MAENSTINDTSTKLSYEPGDISWMMTSTALVWVMSPGVGLFYSGLTRSKNALSLILLSLAAAAVISMQWLLIGYSLAFSSNGIAFIGQIDKCFYKFDWYGPSPGSPKIPELVFSIYQAMFAIVTSSIIIGSGAGRARFLPTVIFMMLWTTLVYDFVAYWVWNPSGWLSQLGSLDFAGGSPVHIASGTAAVAFAIVLGKRQDVEDRPENVQNVIVGTILIWFGWFGFNGGSALGSGMRAIMAVVVTNMAASAGAITSVVLEYRHKRQFSPIAFCSGAIIGLVAITPGSGFVGPLASIIFGIVSALICNMAMSLKRYVAVDDAADVFIVHGLGGFVGNLLTGIFAQSTIVAVDGTPPIPGGWLDGNFMQVPIQLASSVATIVWSFVISLVLLVIIDSIPGLKLRAKTHNEEEGLDKVDLGMTIISPAS